ncbi:MAG: bestrophin family ion channel [Bacteroidota bacterium]|nr:bestrophin family ion channel [Bacteroidota bacterium]MDP3144082.1 bestrophin family ion channel [Bacteroidota bacterium]MDP3558196.1 bestrophin family ion channel [Bacteroidota bacterium]
MLLNRRIPFYYIFNKIKYDLILVLAINFTAYLITYNFQHLMPEMPLAIPAFIGTSISILLSFKLNQAYDRWWEARKIWGAIVNDSRSFVIQLQNLTTNCDEKTIKKMAYRQIAWCYSLGQTLRKSNPLNNLEELLSAEDIDLLKQHENKPLAILQLNSEDLKKLKEKNQLETFCHIQLDDTIVRLCDSMGRAERIKGTVFPVTYKLFLHFMIYLFVIALDISLIDTVWYFEIPLLLILSSIFLLLEKSARHMQDPFENMPTDTAMTAIARTIEINIKQLLSEANVPEPHQENKFYLT